MPTNTQQLNISTSIVDYLKSSGQDSSFAARTKLASQYGISGYTGSAQQNSLLLSKVRGASTTPPPATPTSVANLDQAKTYVNAGQDADAALASKNGEPPVRNSVQTYDQIIGNITSSLEKAGISKPSTVSLTDTYKDLREEYDVASLENRLNDLNTQREAALAQLDVNKAAERDKPVAQNVIEGRISQQTRNAQEGIDFLDRQITTATNELKTKYGIIDTLMKYTESDYNNAVDTYNSSFQQAITLINTAKGVQDSQKSDLEREQDNARANAQIVINTMKDTGQTYSQLPEAQQVSLTKLGLQSGLGADFFSSVMDVSAGKEILTTIVSSDQTKATIMYKDGTTKVVNTGLPAKRTEVDDKEEKEITAFRNDAADLQLKMSTREIKWRDAWNNLHTKYPKASTETIDNILGLDYRAKYE